METPRLIETAQKEHDRHIEEAERLRDLADLLIDSAEWHTRQAIAWTQYIGRVATGRVVEPPVERHLRLVVDSE